jgi:hypothetical protein
MVAGMARTARAWAGRPDLAAPGRASTCRFRIAGGRTARMFCVCARGEARGACAVAFAVQSVQGCLGLGCLPGGGGGGGVGPDPGEFGGGAGAGGGRRPGRPPSDGQYACIVYACGCVHMQKEARAHLTTRRPRHHVTITTTTTTTTCHVSPRPSPPSHAPCSMQLPRPSGQAIAQAYIQNSIGNTQT